MSPRVIVATGKFVGEGFDYARLDTLFLTMPISWDGLLVQYVGRLHRLHPAKKEVRVFDYVDGTVPVLRRMFDKRLKGYRAAGYEKGELPDGFELLAEPEYAVSCLPPRLSSSTVCTSSPSAASRGAADAGRFSSSSSFTRPARREAEAWGRAGLPPPTRRQMRSRPACPPHLRSETPEEWSQWSRRALGTPGLRGPRRACLG